MQHLWSVLNAVKSLITSNINIRIRSNGCVVIFDIFRCVEMLNRTRTWHWQADEGGGANTITLPQDTAFTLLHILLVYYWPSIWLAPHHWGSYALFTLDLSSNINGSVGVEKEVIPLNPRISILLLKPTCHYMPDVTAMQPQCNALNVHAPMR